MRWAIGGSQPEVLWSIEAWQKANLNNTAFKEGQVHAIAHAAKVAVLGTCPPVGAHQTSGYYSDHRIYLELTLDDGLFSVRVGTLQFATEYLVEQGVVGRGKSRAKD